MWPAQYGFWAAINGTLAMDQSVEMKLKFRCPPEYEDLLPRPFPAVLGLPDWYKAAPQKSFNPIPQKDEFTVKKCPPFIDAMTYGFLIPLAVDLKVEDGEFSWDFEVPDGFASAFSRSPIDFHDPSQVTGTPLFDDDRFIIKFINLWTIEAPAGYSLLFTHPVNRSDLPFTTLTGLVACDTFHDTPVHFPAHWHDADFNGVLPRGTPLVQCLPVKRENWDGDFGTLSAADTARLNETQDLLRRESNVYRRRYRPAMR
jgi:hypothetical protein